MSGEIEVPSRGAPLVSGDADDLLVDELLLEGLPVDLTTHEAKVFSERCEAAITALGSEDSLLRIKLMTASLVALSHTSATTEHLSARAKMADEVWAMAENLSDEVAAAYAHVAWSVTRPVPEFAQGRVHAATITLATAKRFNEDALVPIAKVLQMVGLLELGEIRTLDVELLAWRVDIAARGRASHADPAEWFHCLRSILDGDTVAAEHTAEALWAQARQHGTDGLALYTTQMGMIRWLQGRIDGIEEGFLAARREYPEQLLWTASLAWFWLTQGRRTSGEALLLSLPSAGDIPRDRYWHSTITVLAEIARMTGSRANAERLRQLLVPVADRLVSVGVGVAFWGTCARTLGLLEERLGLLDEAQKHLELAVTLSSRIGALAWQAEAQIELAEFALRHDIADIPAYALLAEARATSEARGFPMLARRAMHRPHIRVLGRFEVLALDGTRAEWNSRKARELLKMLVAARGVATSREVFMDALWPGESSAKLRNRFSVAVNVIRRAFDPDRLLPTQQYLVTEGDSVFLDIENLDIDLERFLTLARRLDDASRNAARKLYRGDAFSDESYADWAVSIRDHARNQRDTLG